MVPTAVGIDEPLEYSNVSPGLSTGCSPTTPMPRTSCTWLSASVMIQWRLTSCALTSPWLVIRMVYANTYRSSSSSDWSGRYVECAVTATLYFVLACGIEMMVAGSSLTIRHGQCPPDRPQHPLRGLRAPRRGGARRDRRGGGPDPLRRDGQPLRSQPHGGSAGVRGV